MSALRYLPAIAALALAPLAPAQSSLGGKPWNPNDQVNFHSFQSGTNSLIKTQGMFELMTEGDFQVYWMRATGQAAQTAPRGIDWLRERVIAIHLGERPTGGYSVMVRSIDRNAGVAVVRAVERKPAPRQWVSKEKTSPYTIIRVDRTAARFQLALTEQEGGVIPGGRIIVTDPGTVVVSPNDYERPGGGGYVDPRFDVPWSVYTQGFQSQIRERRLVTIDSPFDWNRYWDQASSLRGQGGPSPRIDWQRYRLVAVHLGQRPTGGFQIKVTRVERNGTLGIIRAVEETPVPGTMVTQALTSPYVIIQVPRDLAQFRLDLSQRQRGPGNVRVID
jgi:hypothetical protein